MDEPTPGLDFEQPLFELEARIHRLHQDDAEANKEEVRRLRRELAKKTEEVYANLSPWDTVKVARHNQRPHTIDYLQLCFEEFVELHGDRTFGDDRAILTGFAKIDGNRVMVVGHEKGRSVKERNACYFGCAHPEGYRKAIGKMKMAAKYGLPIICMIDTPGAYPGIGAEERGQAWVIAENMHEMSQLGTPIICVVIGEGGSGGALGIGVGNRVGILRNAYYSVISPEGCAGILWKSGEYAEQAAQALRFTSESLHKFGVVDDIIDEPLGGAHRDPQQMASRLKQYLVRTLRDLQPLSPEQLVQQRYDRFRRIGVFHETAEAAAPTA